MAAINIEGLSHSYLPDEQAQADYALKNLNLQWRDGGAYALLGPSGCGKTSLLNILSGLIRPTTGRIKFDQQDVTSFSAQQRQVAKVFQFPVIYETLSVFDNLAFPLRSHGHNKTDTTKRVQAIAELLGLETQLDKKAIKLPTDLRQLVSLGRGLVRKDVNAILFDEPLTVIDPQRKWWLRTRLRQLHDELRRTMIYVTHDQTEALTFADTVMVMKDGEVLQSGSPQELFDAPSHRFVGRFIGSPGMNFLPCDFEQDGPLVRGCTVRLDRSYAPENEQPLTIGVRPEFVRFSTDGGGVPASLRRVEHTGRRRIAHLDVAGVSVCVSLPLDQAIPSDNHHIEIDAARGLLYAGEYLLESAA